jgi:hypothetical protein
LLAAIGLVVPALLETTTVFVPLAAVGLVLLMLGAMVTQARRREIPNVVVIAVLGGLPLFLARQRFGDRAPVGAPAGSLVCSQGR